MKVLPAILAAGFAALGFSSCAKTPAPAPATAPPHHEHHAPHAGTPVALGHEEYHLEFVRDAASGKLTAYVLDGEMEEFIRIKAPAFDVEALVGGEKRLLQFQAVANSATGETVGDTSCFEAQADWLKTTPSFDATLTTLKIKNTTFLKVAFNFPKGND